MTISQTILQTKKEETFQVPFFKISVTVETTPEKSQQRRKGQKKFLVIRGKICYTCKLNSRTHYTDYSP